MATPKKSQRISSKTIIGNPVPSVNKWSFEKPDRKPCVTKFVPIDQLDDYIANMDNPGQQVKRTATTTITTVLSVEPPRLIPKSDKNQFELQCAEKLAKAVKGEREVVTLAGRIDVLSKDRLYELKMAENWKHALGQLLVYGFYYPAHQLVLVLVGNEAQKYLPMATKHCNRFDVCVKTFET